MEGQQICLKWNSFQSSIVTSFESLWEEQGFVDVTLASDGHCVQAHKIILSACSPFFKKIFQANPCQHPVIILQDVRFTEIESLLSFIYKGEVNIDQKDLGDLLRAAETLQIRGLSGTLNQSKSKKKKSSASKKASLNKSTDSLADEQPPVKKTKTLAKEETRTSSPPPLTPFVATPSARSPSPEPSQFDDPVASDADSLLTPVLTLQDDAFDDEDSMDKTARQAAQAMDEMREIAQQLTNDQDFVVGSTYSSYAAFKADFNKWADAGHHPMCVRRSSTISNNELDPFPYDHVILVCKHFGTGRKRSRGIRRFLNRNPDNCPVLVEVTLSKKRRLYVVKKVISEHTHPVSAELRAMYPDRRIPKGKDLETVKRMLEEKTPLQGVLRYCHQTLGIKVTAKDVQNLKKKKLDTRYKSRALTVRENIDTEPILVEDSDIREDELASAWILSDHGYSQEIVLPTM